MMDEQKEVEVMAEPVVEEKKAEAPKNETVGGVTIAVKQDGSIEVQFAGLRRPEVVGALHMAIAAFEKG